jgi:hypothetical protein
VAIYIDSFVGPAKEVWEAWPEDRQKRRTMMKEHVPLNVKCLNAVEWEGITLKKSEGSRLEPKYVVE